MVGGECASYLFDYVCGVRDRSGQLLRADYGREGAIIKKLGPVVGMDESVTIIAKCDQVFFGVIA